jgi:hypothetical protein
MSDHVKSLDTLSEWMSDQDLDMQCPDGVLDPAETAIFIRDLTAEIERLRAENKRLLEENCDWHSCVNTSITMSGPVFTGGNLSGLTRCFERYIRKAALADQIGGEG